MSKSMRNMERRQNEVLEAMGQIRVMERGTLTPQKYLERAARKEGKGAVGPYWLWQGTVHGQRFGVRVSGHQAQRVQEGIAQRHAFSVLCEEYIDLACQRSALASKAASQEAEKKGLKSRPSRRSK